MVLGLDFENKGRITDWRRYVTRKEMEWI